MNTKEKALDCFKIYLDKIKENLILFLSNLEVSLDETIHKNEPSDKASRAK